MSVLHLDLPSDAFADLTEATIFFLNSSRAAGYHTFRTIILPTAGAWARRHKPLIGWVCRGGHF